MDNGAAEAFNKAVPESWALGERVFVEDARGDGSYVRITWHRTQYQFVISHWRDDVCLAATRVPVAAAPKLVALLAKGLGDAVAADLAEPAVPARRAAWWRQLAHRLRRSA